MDEKLKSLCITTSINDINDELLVEILCRLPLVIAIAVKTVSKRWRSLISDPYFRTRYSQLIDEKKQPCACTYLVTTSSPGDKHLMVIVEPSWSCKMFLKLTHGFTIRAAFKHLILCSKLEFLYLYYPTTNTFVRIIPPYPCFLGRPSLTVALVYKQGRRFRIVAVERENIRFEDGNLILQLVVYISESCKWKYIDVRFLAQLAYQNHTPYFSCVVCKDMVCIRYGVYFGAFDPFKITSTTLEELTAMKLPLPPSDNKCILLQSCGKLVAMDCEFKTVFNSVEPCVTENSYIWKLDLKLENNGHPLENNEQPLRWVQVSKVNGGIKVDGSMLAPWSVENFVYDVLGVLPNEEHLVYLVIWLQSGQNQLVSLDTRSNILKPLTEIPRLCILDSNNSAPVLADFVGHC